MATSLYPAKLSRPAAIAASISLITGSLLGFYVGQQDGPTPAGIHDSSRADVVAPSPKRSPEFSPSTETRSTQQTQTSAFKDLSSDPRVTDVESRMEQIFRERDPNRKQRELDTLCASLDAAGAKRALDLIQRKKKQPGDQYLVQPLVSRWAELEPKSAADYADAMRDGHVLALHAAVQTWAASDPTGAKNWALSKKDRETRQYSINSVVSVLAESDPKAALQVLEEMPKGEDKYFYLSTIFDRVTDKSPELAAELAATLPSSAMRQFAAESIAGAWGQSDPAAALAWLSENNAGESDTGWTSDRDKASILRNWVNRDPEAAAAYVSDLPVNFYQEQMLKAVAGAWGTKDPRSAAQWIESLPKNRQTVQALSELVSTWTANDPKGVAEFLLARPNGPSRGDLLSTLGREWAMRDAQGALAWARQQNDPQVERTVEALAIAAMVKRDRAQVAGLISQLKSIEAQEAALSNIAFEFSREDPQTAASWMMNLPEHLPVGDAIEQSISTWTIKNQDAVADWLNQQSGGPRRDAAVNGYAKELAVNDAQKAASWANTISDEQLRRRRVDQVVSIWARSDAGAARQWILQQRFPRDEQQSLLGLLERQKK